MHTDLREFLSRFCGVVAMTLVPVVFVAFLSLPLSLNRHPGEPLQDPGAAARHMT